MVADPVVHVVVLPTPAPEHVREPVDLLEMLPRQSGDPPKYCGVGQFVGEGGHPGGHVEGHPGRAVVQVGLVHGEEVDVVEDRAGEVEILHRLSKANIEQHSPEALLLKSCFTIQQGSRQIGPIFRGPICHTKIFQGPDFL